MEEFNEAQHNQERMRGMLRDSRESLENAFVEFKEACRSLEDAGKRVAETKRKADEAMTKSGLTGIAAAAFRHSVGPPRKT